MSFPEVPNFLADRYSFTPSKGLCATTPKGPVLCCHDMIVVDGIAQERGAPVAQIRVILPSGRIYSGNILLSAIRAGSTTLKRALAGRVALIEIPKVRLVQQYLQAWVDHLQALKPESNNPRVQLGAIEPPRAPTTPRSFDPEGALSLTYQHAEIDRLSRDHDARYERFHAALHEAHHLMGTVLFDQGVGGCWIPPTHKRPIILDGARGEIFTCGADVTSDSMIKLMGPICEELVEGDINAHGGLSDLQAIEALMRESPHLRQRQEELTQCARDIAIGYAAEIDLAACAMLYMSNQQGRVSARNMQQLYNWLSLFRSWDSRSVSSAQALLDERPLFISTLPTTKDIRDELVPSSRKQYRQQVRREVNALKRLPN